MIVRPYRPRDAEAIVHLYNSHSDSPNPVSGGIVEEEFQRELEERGSTVFLVAEEAGSIVGTFGMFRTNGRHTMADDEVFADMFYVTPSHRLSTVPGQLITEAISECFIQGINVIRLTVNPANISALKVYRKVGCACLGATDAGEDGNIELYNFIPLVLRATITKLDHDCIRALADMTSFACITEGRPLDLSHDFIVDAGRKIVSHSIQIGRSTIHAMVDTGSRTIVEATLDNRDWDAPRQIVAPTPCQNRPEEQRGNPVRLVHKKLEVTFNEGVIEISTTGHWGPVLAMSWPSSVSHRAHGWRQGPAKSYRCELLENCLVLDDEGGVKCTISLNDCQVAIRMDGAPKTELRMYQWCSLRQGYLTADTGITSFNRASSGLGVAVRDSSEIVAAGLPVIPDTPITWSEGDITVQLDPCGRASLIHSTLVDRRIHLDESGSASLTMTVFGDSQPHRADTVELPPLAAGTDRIVLKPAAGGVTTWRLGATKVLKSPWPHARALGPNPIWRAGLWVSHEPDRHDRRQGMGWGPDHRSWTLSEDTMTSTDGTLSWRFSGSPDTGWTVDVTTSNTHGETVVWLTPDCPAGERIRTSDHAVTTMLDISKPWQRWTTRCAIPLRHGKWFLIEPDHDLTDSPEILMRSVHGVLLVGCVERAHSGSASWRFAITSELPTSNPRRNDYTSAA